MRTTLSYRRSELVIRYSDGTSDRVLLGEGASAALSDHGGTRVAVMGCRGVMGHLARVGQVRLAKMGRRVIQIPLSIFWTENH